MPRELMPGLPLSDSNVVAMMLKLNCAVSRHSPIAARARCLAVEHIAGAGDGAAGRASVGDVDVDRRVSRRTSRRAEVSFAGSRCYMIELDAVGVGQSVTEMRPEPLVESVVLLECVAGRGEFSVRCCSTKSNDFRPPSHRRCEGERLVRDHGVRQFRHLTCPRRLVAEVREGAVAERQVGDVVAVMPAARRRS